MHHRLALSYNLSLEHIECPHSLLVVVHVCPVLAKRNQQLSCFCLSTKLIQRITCFQLPLIAPVAVFLNELQGVVVPVQGEEELNVRLVCKLARRIKLEGYDKASISETS